MVTVTVTVKWFNVRKRQRAGTLPNMNETIYSVLCMYINAILSSGDKEGFELGNSPSIDTFLILTLGWGIGSLNACLLLQCDRLIDRLIDWI